MREREKKIKKKEGRRESKTKKKVFREVCGIIITCTLDVGTFL